MTEVKELRPPERVREAFTPVMTAQVKGLHRKLRLLNALGVVGVVKRSTVDAADSKLAIAYSMANSKPWSLPARLHGYKGLRSIIERAESLGTVFRTVPAGWFEHAGDVACTYTTDGGAYVFIENQPVNVLHTTDTVLHEIVHTTGPRLGRTTAQSRQDRGGEAYWREEAVAVLGAMRLSRVLNLPRVVMDSHEKLDGLVLQRIQEHCGHRLDAQRIESGVRDAVALLTS